MFPDRNGTVWPKCWACNKLYGGLTRAVVPISYSTSGQLTALIAQVKDEPDDWWRRLGLASLLYTFLTKHRPCLEARAYGRFDYATIVPSHPAKRGGRDHLRELIGSISGWVEAGWGGTPWDLNMLRKLKEAPAGAHRKSIDHDLFEVATTANLAGRRVLLVDDLYTSGSTVASASSALIAAGADPPVVVTIGRHLSLGHAGTLEWARATLDSRGFDEAVCTVHSPPSPFDLYRS